MSTQKQVLHLVVTTIDAGTLNHPSVLVCTDVRPYDPNAVSNSLQKTTVIHSRVTLLSGTQGQPGAVYKCSNCRTQAESH